MNEQMKGNAMFWRKKKAKSMITASEIILIVIESKGHHIEYEPKTGLVNYRNIISPRDGGLCYPEGYFDERETRMNDELQAEISFQIEKLLLNRNLQSELAPLPPGATRNAYMKLQTGTTSKTVFYTDTVTDKRGFQVMSINTAPEFLALLQIFMQCCSFPGFTPSVVMTSNHVPEKLSRLETDAAISASPTLIGYKYSVTGSFGYSFLHGNSKIVTVSSLVIPEPPIRILGNGIVWESPCFNDTIFPGISRYVFDEKAGHAVCKITYIKRGQYKLNDFVIAYCGLEETVFCRNDQQIARITLCHEKKLPIPASLDPYLDWQPSYEVFVSENVDNELLMVICAFPMLRFAY